MAMTVTATSTGGNAVYLTILVLTGATEAGGGSASVSGGTPSATLTPNGSSSYIAIALQNDNSTTAFTLDASTVVTPNPPFSQATDASNGGSMAHANYSGTTAAGTGVAVGASAPTSTDMAAYEILTAVPGVKPAVDASSLVMKVGTTTTTVSNSFTPPPGSVVVAIVGEYVASGTVTLSVSGGGLVWTSRKQVSNTGNGACGIFTATVTAGGSSLPPQPGGQTWRRRFRRPQQQPPGYAPAAAAAPAPLTWLSQPVRARIQPPKRGHGGHSRGCYSGQGPPVPPLTHPVRAQLWPQRKPRRGHGGRAGAPWSGSGPPLTPPSHPVQAHQRQVPRAGRVVANDGIWSGKGPPVVPLHQPVRDPLSPQRPPFRGRVQAQTGIWAPSGAPGSGPPLTPPSHPVQAQRPFARGGRCTSHAGTFSGQGVPFPAPSHPVRCRPQQPPRGRADWLNGVWAASGIPTSGPPLYPLQHPVQAQRPRPRGGRCTYHAGPFSGTGPPVRPLAQPVRSPIPPMRRTRRGHGGKSGAPYSGQGPPARILHGPVRGPLRLRQGGRVAWRAGTYTAPAPPPPFTIGVLTAADSRTGGPD